MPAKSLSRSTKIVPTNAKITGTLNIPSEKTLGEKSAQELTNLKFKEVQWCDDHCGTIGIKLNVGESVKSGTKHYFNKSHTFNQ